jgi:hypothetical protein
MEVRDEIEMKLLWPSTAIAKRKEDEQGGDGRMERAAGSGLAGVFCVLILCGLDSFLVLAINFWRENEKIQRKIQEGHTCPGR